MKLVVQCLCYNKMYICVCDVVMSCYKDVRYCQYNKMYIILCINCYIKNNTLVRIKWM